MVIILPYMGKQRALKIKKKKKKKMYELIFPTYTNCFLIKKEEKENNKAKKL